MPTKDKIPEGKRQMGLLVPIKIHQSLVMHALERSIRINDAYVEVLEESVGKNLKPTDKDKALSSLRAEASNMDTEEIELVKEMAKFISTSSDGETQKLRAMMTFLKKNKNQSSTDMINILMEPFVDHREARRMAKKA